MKMKKFLGTIASSSLIVGSYFLGKMDGIDEKETEIVNKSLENNRVGYESIDKIRDHFTDVIQKGVWCDLLELEDVNNTFAKIISETPYDAFDKFIEYNIGLYMVPTMHDIMGSAANINSKESISALCSMYDFIAMYSIGYYFDEYYYAFTQYANLLRKVKVLNDEAIKLLNKVKCEKITLKQADKKYNTLVEKLGIEELVTEMLPNISTISMVA